MTIFSLSPRPLADHDDWTLPDDAAPGTERPLGPETVAHLRVDFAKSSFASAQELIRFMDQKAFYVLSAVGILTTALGIFASVMLNLLPEHAWRSPFGIAGTLCAIVYLAASFSVVSSAATVFVARTRRPAGGGGGPGILFPLNVVSQYSGDELALHSRLTALTPSEILHDYAGSITSVAAIYEAKSEHVRVAFSRFRVLIMSWLATIALLLAVGALS